MSEPRNIPVRRAATLAVFALAAQVLFACLAFGVFAYCGSRAVLAEACHLAAGVWVWLVVLLHLRHRRLAAEEEAEFEDLERSLHERRPGTALFGRDEDTLHSARTRLKTFEKYFVPACSAVSALLLAGLAAYVYRLLSNTVIPAAVVHAPASVSFVVGEALLAFLLAKYAAGMATEPAWRPLRAGASYMASCAVMLFVVGIGLALVHFQAPQVDRVLAYVVPACMGVITLEIVLSILLDLYRPRMEGREPRFSYDSRLLGLLVEPGTIMRTISETLDYQFGFRVSETWVYRFLEKAIAPLILFQVLTFYLLTCLLIVGPEENAFVERFGKPTNMSQPLEPGLHLKWPWPIERARRYPAKRVQVITIGEFLHEGDKGHQLDAIVWTEEHAKAVYKWMAASREHGVERDAEEAKTVPVNFVTGIVNLHYRITNLYDYVYRHEDAQRTILQLLHRQCTYHLASVDLNYLLTEGRGQAIASLAQQVQAQADACKLGITVQSVGLQDIHPPMEVAAKYEEVVAALERKEAKISHAQGYRNEAIWQAESAAKVKTLEAEAYKYRRETVTEHEAARFEKLLVPFRKAPDVFMHRRRLMAIAEALGPVRKYIVPAWANVSEVDVIDLQDKLQLDVLNAGLTEP